MRLDEGLDPRACDIHLDKRKRVRESNKDFVSNVPQVCIDHCSTYECKKGEGVLNSNVWTR
jgi:hypothetical protein